MLSLAGVAAAETVMWQAAAVVRTGERQVLAKGVKTYSPARDIVVQKHRRRRDGAVVWSKSLLLSDTFAVATNVRHKRRHRGFGLVVNRRGHQNGYSWNWFKRVRAGEFQQSRGSGRVSVTLRKVSDQEELESVEFLDDVTLLYLDDVRRPPGAHSHEVVIRRGSVLRFAAPEAAAPRHGGEAEPVAAATSSPAPGLLGARRQGIGSGEPPWAHQRDSIPGPLIGLDGDAAFPVW